ncbi:MAG: DUF1565 domain-containing protein, partial [Pseudomonadota bacterium]
MPVLHVSPTGQDSHEGTSKFPLKTISQALSQARPGGIIQLAPGTYQVDEQFPLVVPAGVTVTGLQSKSITVQGGGLYAQVEPSLNVAMVLGDRAQVRGLTITNPNGSGLLSSSGAPIVVDSRLFRCQQHGMLVRGTAHPFLSKNDFIENEGTGLLMAAQAKGEVRQNRFERNRYGLSLTDTSAPLVVGNQFVGDRIGVVSAGTTRPVLRQNQARTSQETALWIQDRAQPDIGHPQDLGNNQFDGKIYDIRNDGATPVITAGNQLNPIQVKGSVSYLPSEIPDEAAVPAVLLGNVEPTHFPEPPAPAPRAGRRGRFPQAA